MTTTKRPRYRLFEENSLDDVAEKTAYSFGQLLMVKMGTRKPSRRFKILAAAVYGKTEAELFEKLEVDENES